jgi:hypothetical protein
LAQTPGRCIHPSIKVIAAGNSPQISEKNFLTALEYLPTLLFPKLHKSCNNFNKTAEVFNTKYILDKMAAVISHMTLKRTNGNSYIDPGKVRHRTTLVKHK